LTGLNPLDWTANAFLLIYLLLVVLALVVGLRLRRIPPKEGWRRRLDDPDSLAVLAGGADRLADVAVARRYADGQASFNKRGVVFYQHSDASAAERALARLGKGTSTWFQILSAMAPVARDLEQQLVARGLLLGADDARSRAFWSAMPMLLVIGFGVVRCFLGLARGEAFGFLAMLMLVAVGLALVMLLRRDRRTRAGEEVLQAAKQRADRVRRAPTQNEVGMAVALFGVVVLLGTPFEAVHAMRHGKGEGSGGGDASGGGDSGSSDSGSSGCGGGGCGGCGS